MYSEQRQQNFRKQLQFGEEGEHEVAQFLINQGVTVLPLYQFENDRAPVLFNASGRIVSPDLICFKRDSFMVEVKTKNQWVSFNGRVETGLNKTHYQYYEQIQKATGKDVFVFFNHKKQEPTGFYFCNLYDYTRIWDGILAGKRVYEEMVFYNIDVLRKVHT